MKRFNYHHPVYRAARAESFARTEGWCAYCGRDKAQHAHHWRGYEPGSYLPEDQTTADELIPLCIPCHERATDIRRGSIKPVAADINALFGPDPEYIEKGVPLKVTVNINPGKSSIKGMISRFMSIFGK